MTFTTRMIDANGQRLHVAEAGPEGAPVILFLHGFPEFWLAYEAVASRFVETHRVVLPDQRGVNCSSKPDDVKAYDAKHLVADIDALMDVLSPDEPFVLCGHDWGASVAYAYAIRHASRLRALFVANGVHPLAFQKALIEDQDQRAASQYMSLLRQPDAPERMRADGFAKTFSMFEKFSSAPWLDEAKKAQYREAWARDDALTTMLHWYSSSPMEVPPLDAPLRDFPITDAMREKYAITIPHMVVWGMDDTALLPASRAALPAFCTDLTVVEVEDASHWILHEKPDVVTSHLRAFIEL